MLFQSTFSVPVISPLEYISPSCLKKKKKKTITIIKKKPMYKDV